MRASKWWATAVVTTAAAALGAGATTARADATPFAGDVTHCTATTGSVVAVDLRPWKGPVQLGCDATPPATGEKLLTDTGFTTAGDQHDGPEFLCRIGSEYVNGGTQYPTPAQDPCIVTPPASAYWSYWLAAAGENTWSYSQLGAYSEKPTAGEVEAWVYGGTDVAGTTGQPSFTPNQARAQETAAPGGSGSGAGSGGSGSGGVGSGSSGGSGSGGSGSGGSGSAGSGSAGSGSGSGGSGSGSGGSAHRVTLARPTRGRLTLGVSRHLTRGRVRIAVRGAVVVPGHVGVCPARVRIAVRDGRRRLAAASLRPTARCRFAGTLTIAGPGARRTVSVTATPARVHDLRVSTLTRRVAIGGRVAASARATRAANLATAVRYLVTTRGANGLHDGTSLRRDGYYESSSTTADFGLTIDGAFALAAAHRDPGVLHTVVGFIAGGHRDRSGRSINGWTAIGTPDAEGGAVAKEALLAEVAGRDPRRFAGHDLIAALDQLVCTTTDRGPCAGGPGSYRTAPSTFDETLGIIAQLRAGDATGAAPAIRWLERHQRPDGAWSSLIPSTGDSDVDSTAMAAMALALVTGDATAVAAESRALHWIASRQERDGGFPGAAGDSTNSAALAIQGLTLDARAYGRAIARARGFLAAEQNRDGGFAIAAAGKRTSDVRASTQVVGGLIGTSFGTLAER